MKLTFREIKVEQRSPEWFAARLGRLTGSVAADMMAEIKSGEAAARRDLRLSLALELLTGRQADKPDLSRVEHVQHGVEMEPLARMAFESDTGLLVQESGFLAANEVLAGCSLDGHIGEWDEIFEVKCPKSATHLSYIDRGVLPAQYRPQVMHNLWITGARGAHFYSYDDRLPGKLSRFHVYTKATDLPLDEYIAKALTFINEVEELRLNLEKRAA